MPFSAEICITNTGNTQLGSVLYVYSDLDFYASPFNTNLLTEDLIGVCPYVLDNIPDGTLIVLLKDISNGCCIYISLEPTIDLCIICDVGFNEYSANTVSIISVGDLTGSCENNITDYKVNWYGPDSSTNVQFTSGSGTTFNYNWEHPLTGTSSVFVPPGVYIPEIDSVILNGVTLQETEGVLSNCFLPITVDAFNCSNGTNPNLYYNHKLEFSNSSQGSTPPNLSAVFELSSTTNYFTYAFKAVDISDTLKITYSGSNYDEPLVIEYVTMGGNIPGSISNFTADVFPKSGATSSYFNKVLCLTGLTYINGDKLIIEVEPNQTEFNTDWILYFSCLETFDCDKCIDTNTPYKIIESSITGITGNCDTITINLFISGGCSSNENDNDVFNYMTGKGTGNPFDSMGYIQTLDSPPGGIQFSYPGLYHSAISCGSNQEFYRPVECHNGSSSIYYRSWRTSANEREIEIKFENFDDFTAYTSTFYEAMYFSGSTNPLSMDYYQLLYLRLPTEDSLPNTCGDSSQVYSFFLHPPTVQFVTGNTIEFPFLYTINISTSTITKEVNYDDCLLFCNSSVDGVVSLVNNTCQGPYFDFTGTTTISVRQQYPFDTLTTILTNSTTNTERTPDGYIYIQEYSNITYVASGNPLVNIVNLSAQTCNFSTTMAKSPSLATRLFQYVYAYRIILTNPLDVRDFSIYASPITNGAYTGFPISPNYPVLVYSISGGTVTSNPAYLI
jgi:hypothetical protein